MKTVVQFLLLLTILLSPSCNGNIGSYTDNPGYADIYPVYEGTYIPYNIAPLNFRIQEKGDRFRVRFAAGDDSFEIATQKDVIIPIRKWKKLLEANRKATLTCSIFSEENGKWEKYKDILFTIADEPIDSYAAYRLIAPGYILWGKMGLYQRCLENFEESPILKNSLTEGGCMNCHSFHNQNPDRMLFHTRGPNGGTIFLLDGEVKKIDTKGAGMKKAGTYPRWHPGGRYAVFSTNSTHQGFLTAHTNKIEVFDMFSDIVLYDTKENRMSTTDILSSESRFETFPEWSPDGRYLYFCSAPSTQMPNNYQTLKYDLVRVAFEPETGKFAHTADTLFSTAITGKSMSLPRISPDGKYLAYCILDYGTFPLYHRESNLYLMNLDTGESRLMENVNSNQTESYHSWSSNGRWMIFSSRRTDDTYTRLFISYFDAEGKAYKPFIMPQKNPDHDDFLTESYNIPEFISGKVKVSPYKFAKVAAGQSIQMNK
jgi:hypothetical protein